MSQGSDPLSEILELSVFALYWVVNRTKDTLFIAGKEEKPVQRLPGEPVTVSLGVTPSDTPLLQPVLSLHALRFNLLGECAACAEAV